MKDQGLSSGCSIRRKGCNFSVGVRRSIEGKGGMNEWVREGKGEKEETKVDYTVEEKRMVGKKAVELCGDKDGKERVDPKGWRRKERE